MNCLAPVIHSISYQSCSFYHPLFMEILASRIVHISVFQSEFACCYSYNLLFWEWSVIIIFILILMFKWSLKHFFFDRDTCLIFYGYDYMLWLSDRIKWKDFQTGSFSFRTEKMVSKELVPVPPFVTFTALKQKIHSHEAEMYLVCGESNSLSLQRFLLRE